MQSGSVRSTLRLPDSREPERLSTFRMHAVYDRIWAWTFGRLPYYRRWSPDIDVYANSERDIEAALREFLAARPAGAPRPTFLDVGARRGERDHFAEGFEYFGLDLEPAAANIVQGDICDCPDIPDASYDVVFSLDVFEHLQRPWDAAAECVRITKPGGLLIHRTLFAYRYHPSPIDYWRFTSQALEYLFTRDDAVETLTKGYELLHRRADRRGNGDRDRPPIDYLGGFRENWRVLYIGRKRGG